MDLPDVALPVFLSFLALIWGWGLLFLSCRHWWFPVREARDSNRVSVQVIGRLTLVYRLFATVFMLLVESALCFVTLFRICAAYNDPDVLADSALADTVGIILILWFLVTCATFTIETHIASQILVGLTYLFEPVHTPTNPDSEIEFFDAHSELDMERLPLLHADQLQSTDIVPIDAERVLSDWLSDYGTLVPSTPASPHSNSSATLYSADSGSSSGLASPANSQRAEHTSGWPRPTDLMAALGWEIPPHARRPTYDEENTTEVERGSGTQSVLSDADDEMDPNEERVPGIFETVNDTQSEHFDADDEMDSDGSEVESRESLLWWARVMEGFRARPRMPF